MRSHSSIALFLLGAFLLISAVGLLAQGIVTGTISGTVEDPQHAVISGATVTATQTSTNTNFTSTTDATGHFAVRGLPTGTYSVAIEAPKFVRLRINDVVVNSNQTTDLGAHALTLGTSEVVEVQGTAPMVESNSIQISTSFDSKKVTDLPINNGVDQLAYLVPGVVPTGDVAFGNNNGASFAANGQRGRSTNFQIDGQNNNDNSVTGPQLFVDNPDIISEFQISTNYTAEYGRNLGGVVNIVTKSGTNSYHGTVFESHINNVFDSLGNEAKSPFLDFCAPGQPTASGCQPVVKPQDIQNRFGFTLGGPVVKDKLWLFGGYQGQRIAAQGNFNTAGGVLPTPAGLATLQAVFPNNPGLAALASAGPYGKSGVTFAGTQMLPVTALGQTVNAEFGTVNRIISQPVTENDWNLRGDWQATSKDRVFIRYLHQHQDFFNAVGFRPGGEDIAVGMAADVPATNWQIAADWTRNWTPNLINQVRFSFGKLDVDFQGGDNPSCTVNNPTACPAEINFTGLQAGAPLAAAIGAANNNPQGRENNNWQYQDNIIWQHGRHTLKFGGEYDHQLSPNPFLPLFNGSYNFANFNTLIANTPSRLRLVDGPFSNDYRENDLAFYGQDDWRVLDNLTLNIGLRWEWQGQAIDVLHDQSVARQTGPNPFWNTSLPLQFTTVPKYNQDLNNFGPVFGFAYTPRIWQGLFGQDKTVIRGGFGIKYDPGFYNIFTNVGTSAPFVNLGDLNGVGVAPPIPAGLAGFTGADVRGALASVIPANCGTPTCDPRFRSQTQVATNLHNPYTQQWSFGVQREITPHIAAEVRYVGNHTVGQFQSINGNVALNSFVNNPVTGTSFADVIPAGVAPCNVPGAPGFAAGYANCNNRNVLLRTNTGFSIYNGLQSRLDFQNWHGLSANLAYTYSRVIDNSSEIFSTFAGGQTIVGAQNPFDNNAGERGVAGQDFPHVFTLAATYELPVYRTQQGFVGHLLGGWEVSPIYRYVSGQPWTPLQLKLLPSLCDPTNTISGGGDTCRPIVSNPNAPLATFGVCTDPTLPDCGLVDFATGNPTTASAVHWINNDPISGAFFGNPFLGVGRNTLRGQTINNWNLGVFKNTKVGEKVTVQFQVEAYNLFNRQYRGTPTAIIDNIDPSIDPNTNQARTTFGNNFSNVSGNFNTNANQSGIGIRQLNFGLKVIF